MYEKIFSLKIAQRFAGGAVPSSLETGFMSKKLGKYGNL
jgi:hypothetical protein